MTMTPAAERCDLGWPRVVVTVGTDHHPFDRLVTWINEWLTAHPGQREGFFVQWGATSITPDCLGSAFLGVEQLDAELRQADVIVCHGGPASIAAAWARGMLPIVVPRLPQLDEHVDDHQLRFCLQLAERGRIWLAQTPPEFAGRLDDAIRDPGRLRDSAPAADVGAAVARFGALVEELVSSPRRKPRRPWARRTFPRSTASPLSHAVRRPPEPAWPSSTNRNAQDGPAGAGLQELADEEY